MSNKNVSTIPSGDGPEQSAEAIAERVRNIIGYVDPDTAEYLITGRKLEGTARAALADAEQPGVRSGCAVMGAGGHFGGLPDDAILSKWLFLFETKMALANAMLGDND
jgi:hypothetical protein